MTRHDVISPDLSLRMQCPWLRSYFTVMSKSSITTLLFYSPPTWIRLTVREGEPETAHGGIQRMGPLAQWIRACDSRKEVPQGHPFDSGGDHAFWYFLFRILYSFIVIYTYLLLIRVVGMEDKHALI